MILLDANILIRMCNKNDPDFGRTRRVVFDYRKTETLAVASQSLYEFWAVATRPPANNGLGFDGSRANRWLGRYVRLFRFLPEPLELFQNWTALITKHDVRGFRPHDARYVAMMQLQGITQLMTYNVKHFQDYGISILDPSML
jgi:predicted nucleic acid-binding protein